MVQANENEDQGYNLMRTMMIHGHIKYTGDPQGKTSYSKTFSRGLPEEVMMDPSTPDGTIQHAHGGLN